MKQPNKITTRNNILYNQSVFEKVISAAKTRYYGILKFSFYFFFFFFFTFFWGGTKIDA